MDFKYCMYPYIPKGENVGVWKYTIPNIDINGAILHPRLQKWVASWEEEYRLHEQLSGPKICQIQVTKAKCHCDYTTGKEWP